MNKVLIALFLVVCMISIAYGANSATKICNSISKNPTVAKNKVNKLINALNQGIIGGQYPLTVKYIQDHSSDLLAGGSSCEEFLKELGTQFQSELQSKKGSTIGLDQAKQKLLELVQKLLEN